MLQTNGFPCNIQCQHISHFWHNFNIRSLACVVRYPAVSCLICETQTGSSNLVKFHNIDHKNATNTKQVFFISLQFDIYEAVIPRDHQTIDIINPNGHNCNYQLSVKSKPSFQFQFFVLFLFFRIFKKFRIIVAIFGISMVNASQ